MARALSARSAFAMAVAASKRERITPSTRAELLAKGLDEATVDAMFVVAAPKGAFKRDQKCPRYAEVGHWKATGKDSDDADVAKGFCGKKRDGMFSAAGMTFHRSFLVPAKPAK